VKILDGVEDVAICRFSEKDVVRHQLVQRIIAAYETFEKRNQSSTKEGKKTYGKNQGKH
jgi:phosphate starvation-inducible PhoH-like protein